MIFFSDEIKTLLTEATNIQFDGNFYRVLILFHQLWTVFIAVGRYTHCLMTETAKTDLYKTVLDILVAQITEFQPVLPCQIGSKLLNLRFESFSTNSYI